MLSAKKITNHSSVIRKRPITRAERHRMIAEAAYYLAEKRNFKKGCELHDWLEAEARVDRVFGSAVLHD